MKKVNFGTAGMVSPGPGVGGAGSGWSSPGPVMAVGRVVKASFEPTIQSLIEFQSVFRF